MAAIEKCRGPNCRADILWASIPRADGTMKMMPVNAPVIQEVTLANGAKAKAVVLHHSTCPDVGLFRRG